MRAVIAIPARLESTRMSRKLLREATGIPLVCHTVEAALAACDLDPQRLAGVLVATDAQAIAEAVDRFAAARGRTVQTELTRPDHASGSDRIAEAVSRRCARSIDAVVNLQADEPEMPPEEVVRLLDRLEGAPGAEGAQIATLGWPITTEEAFGNPNLVKVVCAPDGTALYFSRASIPYAREPEADAQRALGMMHLGIYAYWRESLERFVALPRGDLERVERLEQLRALEHGMRIVVEGVRRAPSKGIDREEDYEGFVARYRARKG